MAEKEVKVAVLKANDKSQINPTEIVMGNARALVESTPEKAMELMNMQLEVLHGILNEDGGEKPFNEDPGRMLRVQVGLVSISTAIDIWMAKLRQNRIKVYDQSAMPKS